MLRGRAGGGASRHRVASSDDRDAPFSPEVQWILAIVCQVKDNWLKSSVMPSIADEDRCHLNGIALRDGKLAYGKGLYTA